MSETNVIDKIEEKISISMPKSYKVILHNDNITTFDFVIYVLTKIFRRNLEDSIELTKTIHIQGYGIAGSPYTKEIAEQKVAETTRVARANGYPLVASFEEL